MPFGKCKGKCDFESFHDKYIAKRRDYVYIGGFYRNGCGRCTSCELFFIPGITKCPCCNRLLKTRPVRMSDRRILVEETARRY